MSKDQAKVVTVLLADDHPMVMTGFSMSLASFGIKVVGEAKTPKDVIKMYSELSPNVVVMDIRFGESLTGLDAATEILKKDSNANIVFLSQFDQDCLVKKTYELGGKAFVTKDCTPEILANAIHKVSQGEQYFLPDIAARLASLSVRGDNSPQSQLDERELEFFVLMATGMTTAEMAEKLQLSTKTISNVAQSIKFKLGVNRAADITLLAVKHGLIEP